MRTISYLVALLLAPCGATAQVVWDAWSQDGAIETGNLDWTHTPVGTPRFAGVYVLQADISVTPVVDEVVSVTYGAATMTEASCSPVSRDSPEAGAVHLYVLTSGIPTGAQTVTVTVSGSERKFGAAFTLTAGADTEMVDCKTLSFGNQANPSTTLSLTGRTSFAALGFFAGGANTGVYNPLTDWTSRVEADFGNSGAGVYTYDVVSTADVTAGWTSVADDALAIAIAVSQVVPSGSGQSHPSGLLLLRSN